LFQVMCVLQNQPRMAQPVSDLTFGRLEIDLGTAKFDLTFFWHEFGDEIGGLVEHNTDLFDTATIDRLYRHHEALLRGALADPDARILSLPLLAAAERHQLVHEWNDTAAVLDLPQLPVHELVLQQAHATPERLAATFEGQSLTYRELVERASGLAHTLSDRGVRPESLVGICVGRSLDMAVAALAVLQAGGALVALDPAYPWERLATIVDDAGLTVLLTERPLLHHFPQHEVIALCLDDPRSLALDSGGQGGAAVEDGAQLSELAGQVHDHRPQTVPPPAFPDSAASSFFSAAVDLDNPMYAIYTSGSTGRPKGIVVPHRAFLNLLSWQLAVTGGEPVRTVQFATFGFCVSFQEIFSAWCSGGTLVIAGEMARRDLAALPEFLAATGIERLHLPYAALKQLADAALGRASAGLRLTEVITAGEQLKVTPAVRELFTRLPGCRLSNQYGASETHVVTALTLSGDPAGWPELPAVGQPIANVRIHLLDGEGEPVPIGVRGELYAGGPCVPRGYLNDPELTAWKMVPDRFGGEPGARLYRTGDLARTLPDGRTEYLGRADGQVKVRGFRVELGEVETVLSREPGVRDAAVVATAGGGAGEGLRLVAYVVPWETAPSDLLEILKASLKLRLPDYMVPAGFVLLAELPVNANGKLDVPALPVPELSGELAAHRAPRTPVEEVLCAIWSEVLGVARLGVDDGFFALGGHSLLATQAVSRARQAFAVELPLRALFESPTVAALARTVEAIRRGGLGLRTPPLVPL
ncbi:MAG TPA: amino acid adenylation domain-containing protein, partial [Thermoanaerobaculia bacterium]